MSYQVLLQGTLKKNKEDFTYIEGRAHNRLPPTEASFSTPATRDQSGDLSLANALLAFRLGLYNMMAVEKPQQLLTQLM